uniref:Uncharacterized protein n=1 Tax=Arundo donax TaxID=35708 RepID=A0A0A9CA52_ARUDO
MQRAKKNKQKQKQRSDKHNRKEEILRNYLIMPGSNKFLVRNSA